LSTSSSSLTELLSSKSRPLEINLKLLALNSFDPFDYKYSAIFYFTSLILEDVYISESVNDSSSCDVTVKLNFSSP